MITISLDESGHFEEENNEPLFIAGVIFDDMSDDEDIAVELGKERARIRSYYRAVMADVGGGVRYPRDLHSNGDKHRDRNVIRPVKQMVAKTLPEFITFGTYRGKPLRTENGRTIRDRIGKYHLFVMLKSDDGKRRLLSQNANMLARDDWAANRYFHMAGSVVNRIIFHNPLYEYGHMPSINVDIATRSTGAVSELDSSLADEFRMQSYRMQNGAGYDYYSIMNIDIYRALISQEMVNSGKTDLKIDKLNVRSINYYRNDRSMEFLHLSDSLCSMLNFKLTGDSADAWLHQITSRTSAINPKNINLIFGYDEIDNYFSAAWSDYEKKNYFGALSTAYDACRMEGAFAEHYRDCWFPYLEKRIRESVTPQYFYKSVNELSEMLTINNLDQEKLLYLMQQFELMAEQVCDRYRSSDMRATVLYKLYDVGVSAFCHTGNTSKALEYYEKCKECAYYVGVDAFLKTNNKMVVCLEDSFEWDRGLIIAKKNVEAQQLASEIQREIMGMGDETDFLDEARAISQMARILAEKRDPEAEAFFREALGKLEKGSANYKITQSFLLHFYADMGMQDKFDAEIKDYFDGAGTFNQQLRYLINMDEDSHSEFSNEYAMYILIRGLYYFHSDEISDAVWKKLCKLDTTITKNTRKKPSGHPWEITYKYLEMLAIKRGDAEARKQFAKLRVERVNERGEIIMALERFGEAEIADLAGEFKLRDSVTLELAAFLRDNFEIFSDTIFSEDPKERYEELQEYFTFMFR